MRRRPSGALLVWAVRGPDRHTPQLVQVHVRRGRRRLRAVEQHHLVAAAPDAAAVRRLAADGVVLPLERAPRHAPGAEARERPCHPVGARALEHARPALARRRQPRVRAARLRRRLRVEAVARGVACVDAHVQQRDGGGRVEQLRVASRGAVEGAAVLVAVGLGKDLSHRNAPRVGRRGGPWEGGGRFAAHVPGLGCVDLLGREGGGRAGEPQIPVMVVQVRAGDGHLVPGSVVDAGHLRLEARDRHHLPVEALDNVGREGLHVRQGRPPHLSIKGRDGADQLKVFAAVRELAPVHGVDVAVALGVVGDRGRSGRRLDVARVGKSQSQRPCGQQHGCVRSMPPRSAAARAGDQLAPGQSSLLSQGGPEMCATLPNVPWYLLYTEGATRRGASPRTGRRRASPRPG